MPADFQILIARTMTGEVVDALDAPGWSMTDALAWSDTRSLSADLPLPGRDRAGQLVRASLRSVATAMSACSLVLTRDRTALFAGPVTSCGWDADGVNITAAGLTWIFDRRMAMNPAALGNPAGPAADVTLNLDAASRAIALLQLATTGTRRGLPITLPAQSGDEGDQVVYTGADLRTVHEAIKDIVDADGGPDIVAQPVLSPDLATLSWSIGLGAPMGGPNREAVWDFPLTAIGGDLDDSETVDRPYVQGNTSGEDTALIGTWSNTRGAEVPALERADRTTVSETRPEQLAALARSYGEQYAEAVEEITVATPTDAGPQYRTGFNLGDVGRFTVTGHPWLDDVEIMRRIIGVSMTPESCSMATVGARVTPGMA